MDFVADYVIDIVIILLYPSCVLKKERLYKCLFFGGVKEKYVIVKSLVDVNIMAGFAHIFKVTGEDFRN